MLPSDDISLLLFFLLNSYSYQTQFHKGMVLLGYVVEREMILKLF